HPDWRPGFNPGSEPSQDASTYPSMRMLRETFHLVYADLLVAPGEADPSALSIPNPYQPARGAFPTAGDFVAYLASSALAYHLGQLVSGRGAAGLPASERVR